jgi:hypothetical protein
MNSLKAGPRRRCKVNIALVSGGTRPNRATLGAAEFNQILTNFAPRAKQRAKMSSMPQGGEIDILIATDCISEGQNLQDCDLLVNYDIHWNPVRIIQRFGRIDRIGSLNAQIQLVNFWPTPDLNKYINLKNRVEARMALVDIAATNEDNILTNSELEELIQQDLKYRDKQLMRLKDEVLDLEDFNESVALNAFTLDDFRMDLSNYVEANRARLQDAPYGLYGVVPSSTASAEHASVKPGVIYCLRNSSTRPAQGVETVNPLSPYFLVYIQADGVVRYNFSPAQAGAGNLPRLVPGQDRALRGPVQTVRCPNRPRAGHERLFKPAGPGCGRHRGAIRSQERRQPVHRPKRQAHGCRQDGEKQQRL